MLSVEEARDRILAKAPVTDAEAVPLVEAAGRVPVARAVAATADVPPFANSSMDGFALRSADTPGELRLAGEAAAGATVLPSVSEGTTVRIMTGAPLPPGADAVVPVELATVMGDGTVSVPATAAGTYVRPLGQDTRRGDRIDLPAEPLAPATIAVLASLGCGAIEVRRRPLVAILSTGDELVAPGEQLGPGQIHDANSASLAAAVAEAGGEPQLLPRAADDAVLLEAAVRQGAHAADLLVASGGVSVGQHDHVRTAIERLGELTFWRIAVQPGKPLAFGSVAGRPVIGLPGNPVSALVTFELFVRPMVRAMLGLSGDGRVHLPARLDERIPKDPGRRAYLRVVVRPGPDGWLASAAGGQGSAQLRSLAAANALLVVPEGEAAGEPGALYDAILLGGIA
ncbi:MAG: molybdopterin molybdotransferase MoeA [Chloroflexota bacterium]|nr:molybdopterin molybdotransferase MoeA [Chloroflexota bacterium]